MVLGSGPLAADVGDLQNERPPVPHLGSVSGNAEQFTYGYPLKSTGSVKLTRDEVRARQH